MAQKTEKEETEFKVPEALTLCVNNCGFTGNPATNNMCQKCFSATTSATTITTTTSNTLPSNNPTTTTTTVSSSSSSTTAMEVASTTTTTATTSKFMSGSRILKFTGERSVTVRSAAPRSPVKDLARGASQRAFSDDVSRREVNRCTGCRRKVGLTGIRCRCGELFCWEHRYSDRHDCSYDYKSAGREAIARENPVVKAAKIVRV